ncbi:hypothetical protein [Pedobacter sp. GR22-6]|uniref:hypothetical protein n=1 Tax=Pedobacter sp. GR22-6 TaxID=3127957 RepID=UPI00307E0500
MDEAFILNELRSLILSKTGIRTITPADCKRISIEISKTLNKNVSETTIKRLFGFAKVKHNFSKFTLTTLSEYVNEPHPEKTSVPVNVSIQTPVRTWREIHEKAVKITDFTLKSIKNRSGMPYEMTISRKFAEHDFEEFFKSKYSFTCFISQPGYGRTILLSHLADFFHNNKQALYKDSTLFFITANSFFNRENIALHFEEHLKLQLGIHPKDTLINYANKNYNQTGGKLVIFLDGFSELVLKRDLKKQLFESIINFICSIEDNNSIKLVMSMRSTTWIRFHDCIRHSAYLKTKWFHGNYFDMNDISNVPPLTEKEVDLILSKIHHIKLEEINPKLKTQLKFPLHIQLYYQLKEEDPYFNYATNITFYELISRFIQDKIYRSNYYTEKILFLKKIIQLTDFGNKGNSVMKDELISELSAFKNAYMELLSDGILMEEKSLQEYHPRESVRFIHPHVFEYFLFIELLERFHLRIEEPFFQYVKNEFASNHSKFQLLQWAIRFIVRTGDLSTLAYIFDLDLNSYERSYLVLFIAENLDYRTKYSPETIESLKKHHLHELIIKELLNFDFIDTCYRESITVLMKVADSEKHLLTYNVLLACFDILSLNPQQIKTRMDIIAKFRTDDWSISPHELISLIYSKIQNKEFKQLPADHFKELIDTKSGEAVEPEQALSYVLLSLLNLFYGNQANTLKRISEIPDEHPDVLSKKSAFSIFTLSILGQGSIMASTTQKTAQLESILKKLENQPASFEITGYTESLIRLMQAEKLKENKEFDLALQYAFEALKLFKKHHLHINVLFAYNLIIDLYLDSRELIKANEYKYERLCFIEEHQIPNHLFINSGEPRR